MADCTFYDPQWTVLQKLKFIEGWSKKYNIDPDTITFDVVEGDDDYVITVKGTNFLGQEVVFPSLTLPFSGGGTPGKAATVDVGTTETLEAGQAAYVTNVGTTSAAILDFGIPRGEQGERGEQGDPGEPGEPGEQGEPGVGVTNVELLSDINTWVTGATISKA